MHGYRSPLGVAGRNLTLEAELCTEISIVAGIKTAAGAWHGKIKNSKRGHAPFLFPHGADIDLDHRLGLAATHSTT